MSAAAAERQRGVAAPVEEQQGLLAPASRPLDARDRALRQPASARRAFAPQVHGRDLGQAAFAEARGELEPAIAAGFAVYPPLQRGRPRRQPHPPLLHPPPPPP